MSYRTIYVYVDNCFPKHLFKYLSLRVHQTIGTKYVSTKFIQFKYFAQLNFINSRQASSYQNNTLYYTQYI